MTVNLPQTANYKVPDTQTLIGLIISDEFAMQEKIDGRRLMVLKSEHGVVGYNKKYEAIDMPGWIYDTMAVLPGHPWVFDGELTDKGYHVFDLVDAPGDRASGRTFDERILMLSALIGSLGQDRLHSVSLWFEPKDKLMELLRLKNEDAEGVVFRPRNSSPFYVSTLYKYKFYGTVDAIASELLVDGRRTVELELLRDHEYVSIGRCKVDYDIQEKMKPNTVVEIRYRKVSEAGRLIEPVFQRIRYDKRAYECTYDQLAIRQDSEMNDLRVDSVGAVVAALGITPAEAKTLLSL